VQYTNIGGLAVFEGCILLGRTAKLEQLNQAISQNPALLDAPDQIAAQGLAIAGEEFRWEGGVIPFVFHSSIPAARRQTILDGIEHWHQKTKIRLREKKDSDTDWIRFVDGGGCASAVGRQGGPQDLVFGGGCGRGNAIHEIGHAVGLWHEQGRSDRDSFIEIVWSNIQPNARHNFTQHIDDGENLGSYDLGSIMHYGARFFAIDPKKDTIRVKVPEATIGQREGLSPGDIAAVAQLYPDL